MVLPFRRCLNTPQTTTPCAMNCEKNKKSCPPLYLPDRPKACESNYNPCNVDLKQCCRIIESCRPRAPVPRPILPCCKDPNSSQPPGCVCYKTSNI